jgi:outer membrane protein OmpA-like peptidoglycan-associated protein
VASLLKVEKTLEDRKIQREEFILEDSSKIQKTSTNNTILDSSVFEKYFKKVNLNIDKKNKYQSVKNIEFYFDKYSISLSYKYFLDSLIESIEVQENISVIIEGHTDNVGSEDYNLILSQQRANTVLNYFITKGIDKSRLTAKGIGEVKPIASNANPTGRALNRRTEIYIIYLKKKE